MRHALSDRASALGDIGLSQSAMLGVDVRKIKPKLLLDKLSRVTSPAPGANMDLDFSKNQGYVFGKGIADATSLITFTRASTATYTNSAGLIASAAINTPRIDYDPVTLACKGLLIEEARTNLLLGSGQMTNATYWSVGTNLGSFFVATADALTAPDGSSGNVAKFVTGATTSQGLFARQSNSLSANTYAGSLYVYVPTQSGVTNWGLIADFGDIESFASGAQTTFDRWVRVSGVTALAATRTQVDLNIVRNGVAPTNGDGFTFYTWGADLQAGSSVSSHIPTVASQVTRAADVATMTGANFSSWYSATAGTLCAEAMLSRTASSLALVAEIGDGTYNNREIVYFNASNSLIGGVTLSGVGTNLNSGATAASGTIAKFVHAFTGGDQSLSANGSSAAVNTAPASLPVVNALRLGFQGGGGGYLNGHIRRITYYATRLPDATLQALSA